MNPFKIKSPNITNNKFLISLYVRPLTKEIFDKKIELLSFVNDHVWDESLNMYFDTGFWDDFHHLSQKSLYKVVFILSFTCEAYYDSYNGEWDVDDIFSVDNVLLSTKASDFSELREVVATWRDHRYNI